MNLSKHRNMKVISTNPSSGNFLISRMDKTSNRIKQSESVCGCWGRVDGI